MTTIPPTPPPATPAPPETVQIQLPPEVVESITPPDPSGFTQPVATIIAAIIALAAAGVAFWGVNRQIKANNRNTERLLEAQRVEAEKNRHSSQRAENIAVMSEAVSVVYELCDLVGDAEVNLLMNSGKSAEQIAAYRARATEIREKSGGARDQARLLALRLKVLDFDDAADALTDVNRHAFRHIFNPSRQEIPDITSTRNSAISTFKQSLNIPPSPSGS